MQIILCTINCYTRKQLMVIPLVSCFFYGHSMESLSAINLNCQLMTSMFFLCSSNDFYVFFRIFFWQSTSKFLFTYFRVIQRSGTLQDPRRKPVSNFQSVTLRVFAKKEKLIYTFAVVGSTLHHCRLYFSGMGIHKISFLILGNQKST